MRGDARPPLRALYTARKEVIQHLRKILDGALDGLHFMGVSRPQTP